MSCFVSTHVKLATNDNVVKLVTAQCYLARVQLFFAAAVGHAKTREERRLNVFRFVSTEKCGLETHFLQRPDYLGIYE